MLESEVDVERLTRLLAGTSSANDVVTLLPHTVRLVEGGHWHRDVPLPNVLSRAGLPLSRKMAPHCHVFVASGEVSWQ